MAKQTKKQGTVKSQTQKGEKVDFSLEDLIGETHDIMDMFMEHEHIENMMTGSERRRLIGTGIRNYGFIDKAFDIARDNPQFLPTLLTLEDIMVDMEDFENVRQLMFILEKFMQAVNDTVLVRGDKCFRHALRIYQTLREMTRNKVPGAEPLFEALLTYFRHRRRGTGDSEPTLKELERDFHKLIHGTADGKLLIENEMPKATAGKRKIIDEVRNDRKFVQKTRELNDD